MSNLLALLDDIERHALDINKIENFEREGQFVGCSVDLLTEAGSYVCIAANVIPPPPGRYDRNTAIISGHLVRLYKLISSLLDQTVQHRAETVSIFTRLAFETIVSARHLMKHNNLELFDSYVRYSLKHEKKLHNDITSNIQQRGGVELPIERRMLNSIERAVARSGFSINEISANKPQHWGDKSLFDKAKDLKLDKAYLAAFGGGSHNVHGAWQDLLSNHLTADDGGYLPHVDWHEPRPQGLLAIALLSVDVVKDYFVFSADDQSRSIMEERLADFEFRLRAVDEAHEQFLVRRASRRTATERSEM